MFHPDVMRTVADQRHQALVDAATKHRRLRIAARTTGRQPRGCDEDAR